MSLERLYDLYTKLRAKRNIDGNSKEALDLVKHEAHGLRFINNPSEAVCLEAIRCSAFALGYINNPSEAMCLVAIEEYEDAVKYIPQHIFDNMIKALPKELRLISPSENIRNLK